MNYVNMPEGLKSKKGIYLHIHTPQKIQRKLEKELATLEKRSNDTIQYIDFYGITHSDTNCKRSELQRQYFSLRLPSDDDLTSAFSQIQKNPEASLSSGLGFYIGRKGFLQYSVQQCEHPEIIVQEYMKKRSRPSKCI